MQLPSGVVLLIGALSLVQTASVNSGNANRQLQTPTRLQWDERRLVEERSRVAKQRKELGRGTEEEVVYVNVSPKSVQNRERSSGRRHPPEIQKSQRRSKSRPRVYQTEHIREEANREPTFMDGGRRTLPERRILKGKGQRTQFPDETPQTGNRSNSHSVQSGNTPSEGTRTENSEDQLFESISKEFTNFKTRDNDGNTERKLYSERWVGSNRRLPGTSSTSDTDREREESERESSQRVAYPRVKGEKKILRGQSKALTRGRDQATRYTPEFVGDRSMLTENQEVFSSFDGIHRDSQSVPVSPEGIEWENYPNVKEIETENSQRVTHSPVKGKKKRLRVESKALKQRGRDETTRNILEMVDDRSMFAENQQGFSSLDNIQMGPHSVPVPSERTEWENYPNVKEIETESSQPITHPRGKEGRKRLLGQSKATQRGRDERTRNTPEVLFDRPLFAENQEVFSDPGGIQRESESLSLFPERIELVNYPNVKETETGSYGVDIEDVQTGFPEPSDVSTGSLEPPNQAQLAGTDEYSQREASELPSSATQPDEKDQLERVSEPSSQYYEAFEPHSGQRMRSHRRKSGRRRSWRPSNSQKRRDTDQTTNDPSQESTKEKSVFEEDWNEPSVTDIVQDESPPIRGFPKGKKRDNRYNEEDIFINQDSSNFGDTNHGKSFQQLNQEYLTAGNRYPQTGQAYRQRVTIYPDGRRFRQGNPDPAHGGYHVSQKESRLQIQYPERTTDRNQAWRQLNREEQQTDQEPTKYVPEKFLREEPQFGENWNNIAVVPESPSVNEPHKNINPQYYPNVEELEHNYEPNKNIGDQDVIEQHTGEYLFAAKNYQQHRPTYHQNVATQTVPAIRPQRVNTVSRIKQLQTEFTQARNKSALLYDKEEEERRNERAQYKFGSWQTDGISDLLHDREEHRENGRVTGSYSYSDGYYIHRVHYVADKGGYRILSEDTSPVGNGPQTNPLGVATIRTAVSGQPVHYTVRGEDLIRLRWNRPHQPAHTAKQPTTPTLS